MALRSAASSRSTPSRPPTSHAAARGTAGLAAQGLAAPAAWTTSGQPSAPRSATAQCPAANSHPLERSPLGTSASPEQRELVCSLVGLTVKVALALVAGVSLVQLAHAYQQRMERQGELVAVLDLEKAKLARARDRFDRLFAVDGEQRLIREQNQWIAPNRLRIVWHDDASARSAAAQQRP